MSHFHIKRKKGRPYLYVREIARVNKKPKVVSQIYVGSPNRVVQLVQQQGGEDLRLKVQEFGALWAANLMDRDVDIVRIVDDVVGSGDRETGPSVGEYFLYAVLNRCVDATSKNALADWYQHTAIQTIRPVDLKSLTSERYWAKWDRLSPEAIEEIGRRFFARIQEVERPQADCLLFDTTNYYTFMASHTPSDLAVRGKNKAGRHHLRQIGLGLLVSRKSRLPLYHSVYPGNRHDSKEFGRIMDEMFGIVAGLDRTKERLTVVIDKGMNAEGNFAWIDEHPRVHFVTSYSPYFAQDLAATPLDRFEPVDTHKNRQLSQDGREEDRMVAYRTGGEFWGKERTVVVTYYPPTARKQDYAFEGKVQRMRQTLLEMRTKVRIQAPHWKNPEKIRERYHKLCADLHLSSDFYTLTFQKKKERLEMQFRKNSYLIEQKRRTFGKTIIITDNRDWTTCEIIEAHLDRWEVEESFRQSKNDDLVAVQPIRHWTDSKILCHLLTCVMALTYLRRLELRLKENGINRTANTVMDDLQKLHSILLIDGRSKKPKRKLEQPSKTQSEVLRALGFKITSSGVLQQLKR